MKQKEFIEEFYETPKKAIAFPSSNHYEPCEGKVIGIEISTDPVFRLFRYIFEYNSAPKRKVTGIATEFPNGKLYLHKTNVIFLEN